MSEVPKRRFSIKIEIGGDTRDQAVWLLREFVGQIRDGGDACVTGGYSRGGFFKVTEQPEVTHESFSDALEKWIDENEREKAAVPGPANDDESDHVL